DNPQAWNRFSYVMNSPILYNDPSGHMRTNENGSDGTKGCKKKSYCEYAQEKSDAEIEARQAAKEAAKAAKEAAKNGSSTETPTVTGTPTATSTPTIIPTSCIPRPGCTTNTPTPTSTPSSTLTPTYPPTHDAFIFGVSGSFDDGMVSGSSHSAGFEYLYAFDDGSSGLFRTHGYGTSMGESAQAGFYVGRAWGITTAAENVSSSSPSVALTILSAQFTYTGDPWSGSFTVGLGAPGGVSIAYSDNQTVPAFP
ncbi:MAG TPA: hypothetical protein PLZ03_14745, partial [Anaerolineales bacterium]|nr:hypothetical protein [Anaerolineales bacterium]